MGLNGLEWISIMSFIDLNGRWQHNNLDTFTTKHGTGGFLLDLITTMEIFILATKKYCKEMPETMGALKSMGV